MKNKTLLKALEEKTQELLGNIKEFNPQPKPANPESPQQTKRPSRKRVQHVLALNKNIG